MAVRIVEHIPVPAAATLPTPADRAALAARLTRAASAQTYATIRLLADRDRAADAFRAYAYFRWVDDVLDNPTTPPPTRAAFLARQRALLDGGYSGRMAANPCAEEALLADLIAGDDEPDSGLQSYLRNMMAVMAFDVGRQTTARRSRTVSAAELDGYTQSLAKAVADALFHFIGHDQPPPREPARYSGVRAAHIIHMLRDTVEDAAAGYVNVPAEYLAAHGLSDKLTAADLESPAFQAWVAGRVRLAHEEFAAGRAYLAAVGNWRARLACRAYLARFEWLADAIAQDNFRLRPAYPERKSFGAALSMGVRTIRN